MEWTHEATEVVKCIRPSQNSVDVNCAFQTVVGSISCIVPCGGCPTRCDDADDAGVPFFTLGPWAPPEPTDQNKNPRTKKNSQQCRLIIWLSAKKVLRWHHFLEICRM